MSGVRWALCWRAVSDMGKQTYCGTLACGIRRPPAVMPSPGEERPNAWRPNAET